MASPSLLTPTSSKPPPPPPIRSKSSSVLASAAAHQSQPQQLRQQPIPRRQFLTISAPAAWLLQPAMVASPAMAADEEEYVKDTEEVISKVRSTVALDKNDPNAAEAVAELRAASNNWVAKYRKEKALLGKSSFRDIYSALNAVSGHYVSFGPTAPIPAKRKIRILEEMETAEKALLRGR